MKVVAGNPGNFELKLEGETLRRDAFPAEALLPDGTHLREARVLATSHRVIVLSLEGTRQDRTIVVREFPTSDPAERDRGALAYSDRLRLATEEGSLYVSRARGCGCGSPLKRLKTPIGW